ncbi:curli production assembly/transport protein CsgE [Vibrio sp. SCSIO 43140]|nr:curli production assembly/transport protein CsgE [Vibrio sp. SCSIO 43140]
MAYSDDHKSSNVTKAITEQPETAKSIAAEKALIEKNKGKSNRYLQDSEIRGVIVDRTMTRLGDDFYSFFAQELNDLYPDLKENLTVKEIPTALSGSIIEVSHTRKTIYRTALSPGRRQAEERAQQAVRTVDNYIIRWEAERALQDTFDLEHDEF